MIIYHSDGTEAERLAALLREASYRAIATEDPKAVGPLARKEHADVVLLDVRPGEKAELKLCSRLRSRAETRHIPTVLAISPTRRDALERAREAGAEEVLMKPVNAAEMVKRITMVARLSQVRAHLRSLDKRPNKFKAEASDESVRKQS